MIERPTIEERENGPLVVKGLHRMTGPDGEEIEVKPVMALCRCGGSKNKPFCDGSHKTNGFQSRGGKPAGKDVLLPYEGAEVTVLYNPRLCSHAAECNRLAPHVFDATKRPWVQPDEGSVAEIETVIATCPSGALQLAGRGHLLPDRAEIAVQKNGPYWITGPRIDAPTAGEGATRDKYVLCRCGMSGNKPYCDGTHRDKGWRTQ